MKKILISFLSIICLSVGFISCKNDLDVLAPGKEMVSIYGILDVTQPVQNIRINKVYLNDKDALVSAQDANDINYGPGELTVSLQCFYKNNVLFFNYHGLGCNSVNCHKSRLEVFS